MQPAQDAVRGLRGYRLALAFEQKDAHMAKLKKIIEGVFRGPRKIVTDRIFPRYFAERDHRRGGYQAPPFHFQSGRIRMFENIIKACGIEQIVETGTYMGSTAAWFAGFGLPVYTVEVNPRLAHFARLRFSASPLVHTAMMDSVTFLEQLAKTPERTEKVTLFYLDAHWSKRLPLADEMRVVAGAFRRCVIAIDDFMVPDDPGYAFDDYGPGKRLDLDYVRRVGVPNIALFFPSLPSSEEDGAKRGCVVLTAHEGLADQLVSVAALRAYPI